MILKAIIIIFLTRQKKQNDSRKISLHLRFAFKQTSTKTACFGSKYSLAKSGKARGEKLKSFRLENLEQHSIRLKFSFEPTLFQASDKILVRDLL